MSERERESERDSESDRESESERGRERERDPSQCTLSLSLFAARTDPFHIDATVNVTPVSCALGQRSPSLSCSSPQPDAALARGC